MKEKKVLIISYYWPPSAGSGVQRWLKFSNYLPKFGWSPIIYTPSNPQFNIKDDSLNQDINQTTRVIKRKIWEPYHLLGRNKNTWQTGMINNKNKKKGIFHKLIIWMRGNLIFPDPRVFWVLPSYIFLKRLLVEENIQYIITTSPPHSMHLIGLLLKLKFKSRINWIVDYRDPWFSYVFLDWVKASKVAKNIHKKLEKYVNKKADHIIFVNEKGKTLIQNDKTPLSVITNGYDPVDFQFNKNITPNSCTFTLTHFGFLYQNSNPKVLWKVLSNLCKENELFSKQLRIILGGKISESVKEKLIDNNILKEKINFCGYIHHHEVINNYSQSDILLLCNDPSNEGNYILPGKVFELINSQRWILGIGGEKGDSEKIIRETNMGQVFSNNDEENIKKWIMEKFENRSFPKPNEEEKTKYSREVLTQKLVEILNRF